MTRKEEVRDSEAFKAISSSTPKERYKMLISQYKELCEGHWNCQITEAPYTYLASLEDEDIALAIDDGMGTASLAIIHPL